MDKVILIRNVTKKECNWLNEDLKAGQVFYVAYDPYGCCTFDGIPVSTNKSGVPYFEIPNDAIKYYTLPNFSNN